MYVFPGSRFVYQGVSLTTTIHYQCPKSRLCRAKNYDKEVFSLIGQISPQPAVIGYFGLSNPLSLPLNYTYNPVHSRE